MSRNPIFIGNQQAFFNEKIVTGEMITIDHDQYFKISNNDQMRPFFMNIVSDSNHWMFIASNGGLTAGRKNSDHAIFPYYTDDKITESAGTTGSKTILQVHYNNKSYLWEPFSDKYEGSYRINRNLYKNKYGNKIIFEEINDSLGITFRYQWNNTDKYGFVKKSSLINNTDNTVHVTVLDGIQNILPHGVSADMQNSKSNLVDAYKKSELEQNIGLGIFALSAMIVDRAEPSEALKSNIAWSLGLKNPVHLLSSLQLDNFRKGLELKEETDVRAEKGAFLVSTDMQLLKHEEKHWLIVTDVNQGPSAIVNISEKLKDKVQLHDDIAIDIALGTAQLKALVGNADGLQLTADELINTRHFSNTLFNIMRGGIFDNNYQIEKSDFINYLTNANLEVLKNKKALLNDLPELFSMGYLKELSEKNEDKNFKRLCFEYMPLKFSRRHGDPSRPWNKFSINTRSEIDGSKILDYEGNWRDIFQNWEALAFSYPEFIESMLHKFLNASTFDGYNPYRVTKKGFDWEVIEPDDPWSFIGYWGDHQIIYLLKFLEFIEKHYPEKLTAYFEQDLFVYANVPYKIKSYTDLLKDPKDTIEFDKALDFNINQKISALGADGALLTDQSKGIYKVNFVEKLLATILAKVSNFIPEAGIWLNTQRPEWNDANNALVGNGVSMVTLYYLRRFLNFFEKIVADTDLSKSEISEELVLYFNEVLTTLNNNSQLLAGNISDKERKTVLDGLGNAASTYRTTVYEKGFSGKKKDLSKTDLLNFSKITLSFIDHTIKSNKRPDDLYHAYNLMTLDNEQAISIKYLPEMLEGQVAVLSSGFLSSSESLQLLDSLKSSALYRKDQNSYLLYPNKELPRFTNKNNISAEKVQSSELLMLLEKDHNSQIVEKDALGHYHFNGNFNNAENLKLALSDLDIKYQKLVAKDKTKVLAIFEDNFDHKSFTGRSGTFFGYEGLGSIYWHMVSKLLLAVQEVCLNAFDHKDSKDIIEKITKHYYAINEGIGLHKSPELYGAFPTDPYSHTPAGKGAQQPGMTGQVKEDILNRIFELGVFVNQGSIEFNPRLLKVDEFIKKPKTFEYIDINAKQGQITLDPGSLAFTYCQVPVIYKLSKNKQISVVFNDGSETTLNNLKLTPELSQQIFKRTGDIHSIIVAVDLN